MGNVTIITSSNPSMGSGNLVRCKTLAKKLKSPVITRLPVKQGDTMIVDLKGVKIINLAELTKPMEMAIMDKRFKTYHDRVKVARDKPKRIIMFLGGYDVDAVTLKVIDVFIRMDSKIKKTVLVSDNFMHVDKLEKLKKFMKPANIEVITNAKDIPELIYNADLAISSGGNMMYEFACVGIPIICLPEDEAEYNLCDQFEHWGIVKNLGYGTEINNGYLLGHINVLMNSPDKRQNMIDNGKRFVDGKGLERVLKIIKGEK